MTNAFEIDPYVCARCGKDTSEMFAAFVPGIGWCCTAHMDGEVTR